MSSEPTFKPAQERFELAIAAGCLSTSPGAPNYAGDYMYMGTQGDTDLFKNRTTRRYTRNVVARRSWSTGQQQPPNAGQCNRE